MLIAFAFCFLAEPVKADDRTALDGIYVEDISVSGMTEEQITQAVNGKIEQLKPSVINLSAGEQNAQVTAGDLGLSCANPEVARHRRPGRLQRCNGLHSGLCLSAPCDDAKCLSRKYR